MSLIVTAAEVTTELKLQNRMHRLSSSFNQHESFGISFDDQNLGLSNWKKNGISFVQFSSLAFFVISSIESLTLVCSAVKNYC